MIRTKEGAVVGSIDVAALGKEDDEDLSSLKKDELVDRLPDSVDPKGQTKADLAAIVESLETEPEPEAEDLSSLKKDELAELAEAEGIDTSGMKKDEIREALESREG